MNERPDILNAIPQLEEDLPAEQFMEQSFLYPALAGIAIALVLAGVGVLLWLKLRKKAPAPPTQAELALKAIAELEQDIPPMRELSLRLSLILREFLTGETQDPTLFETHEEFSQRMDALAHVPQECRRDTRFLLDALADMKYSGKDGKDDVQARSLIERARDLVTRINIAQEKAAAEAAANGHTKP